MLNPDKIKEKEFQTTGRGSYRADDVDSFLAEVSSSYEQMFKENGELIKKISLLANKVEEYKKDENSLKEALLAAQKLADKIVADAKEKIKSDLADAQDKVDSMLSSAKGEAADIVAKAKNEADGTILQAKKQADEILGTVNRKVTQESLAFDMLQKESSDFRSKLISMYKEHLNLINDLPALAEEKLAEIEKKEAALAPKEDEKPEVEPEQEKIDEPDEPAENTEPEVIQEEADEKEDDDSGLERFSLSDIGPADEYDDISSDSRFDDDSDSGFSLNVSDAEFDDEDDSTENNSVAENDLSDDDSGEADDDEDDEPVSFKSFFKKK